MAQSLPLRPATRRFGLRERMLRAFRERLRRSVERRDLEGLEATKELGRETGARC